GSWDEHVELLTRTSDACARTGRLDAAVSLVEQALPLVSRSEQPLTASTLLRTWSNLSWERSTPAIAVDDRRIEAVELTKPFPNSPERAQALASLAMAELWDRAPEAGEHVQTAVRVARRSGSAKALSEALATRAFARMVTARPGSLADAEEAAQLARACGDSVALGEAAIWRVNQLWSLGRTHEAAAVAREAFEEVRREGSVQWGYFLAAMAARGMLHLGRWRDCRDLLRTALAARRGGITGALVRLVAAQLAARTGDVPQARQHLERALELVSSDFEGLREGLAKAGAEVLVASGEPMTAFEWVRDRIASAGGSEVDRYDERLLVPLANAAADIACAARTAGDVAAAQGAVALLDDVVGNLPREPFAPSRDDGPWQEMERALYAAEVSRCRGAPDQATRWEEASRACEPLEARWDAAVASLRCGEALLADGAPPARVSEALREAYDFAIEVGAEPFRSAVVSAARTARVDLN
ncbi:MAG: hypothetical protein ACRDPJ_22295, partial [Nocardioidaceae bacterium]